MQIQMGLGMGMGMGMERELVLELEFGAETLNKLRPLQMLVELSRARVKNIRETSRDCPIAKFLDRVVPIKVQLQIGFTWRSRGAEEQAKIRMGGWVR
uniref:GG22515 n=1 Tax=Drosophila erecta TaxID=7220 RepID=B3P0G1_DROER